MSLLVAGCGHDGRLGTGKEANIGAFTELSIAPFAADGGVRKVVAGGYHSFVVTNAGAVYAFGLNEHGQLGLESKAPSWKTPQVVPFFEDRRLARAKAPAGAVDPAETSGWDAPECGLVRLVAGAYHTVAWMDDGVYSCGAGEHGQCGHRDFDDRRAFTKIASVDFSGGEKGHGGGAKHIADVSCGSFHTVVVVRNVQAPLASLRPRPFAPPSAPTEAADGDGDDAGADAGGTVLLPFAVLCCGKGDFGELGYDADAWDKAAAMDKRLRSHVKGRGAYAAMGGDAGELNARDPIAAGGGGAKFKAPFKFKAPAVVRRPEFSSPVLKRVGFPFLDAFAVPVPAPALRPAPGAADAYTGYDDGEEGLLGLDAAAIEAVATCPVLRVEAAGMHHHTAVTVTLRAPAAGADAAPLAALLLQTIDSSAGAVEAEEAGALLAAAKTPEGPLALHFHFGCLYNRAVETVATSIPRLFRPPAAHRGGHVALLHAGNEVMLAVVRGAASDAVLVKGEGNLGLGADDSDVSEFAPLALPLPGPAGEGWRVAGIAGTSHFLITLRGPGVETVAVVFGDNFMGQAGVGSGEAAITAPVALDEVPTQIAAGTRHTLLLQRAPCK